MGSFLTRTYLIRWPGTVSAAVLSGTGQESAAAVASAGRGVIASDVLRHAVDNLHHPSGSALGHPLPGVDGVDPIGGGIGKI